MGNTIGPLPREGLDKSSGLPVGYGRVGPGAGVPKPQDAEGLGTCFGNVGRAVVAHHPTALETLNFEPGDSPAEKADHHWLLLIRQHLDVRKP